MNFHQFLKTTATCLLAGCNLATLIPTNSVASSRVPLQAEPFDLTDVRLLEGPFRDAMLRDKKYILSLDADRLLHSFRVNAGLSSRAEPHGGWEKPDSEGRGHTMGHYLSALALMYSSTGEETLKNRAAYLVEELAKCQDALPAKGFNKGFLAAFPESLLDRAERMEKVWAPYYTMHKIMAGLLEVHLRCDNQQALVVLTRMAEWLKFRIDRLSQEQMQGTLANEHGGMKELLANLYAISRNPNHLKLSQAFNHEVAFNPLARGEDKLDGLHANTQIPKIIGAAREFEITGEPRLRSIANFFWNRVALHRSYVIGGDSDKEHFFPTNDFAKHLSPETAETCNTYNMLKLTRHLFSWEPSGEKMDFYERGLYNQILASQDPANGMFTYFIPLVSGHFKTYSTPTNSFWCCVGTGMESQAKYGDTIYFHTANSLYVNLFISSELNWEEKGITVRQETKFPDEEKITLTMQCVKPVKFALKIRRPDWARDGVKSSINGKPQTIQSAPGSYFTLERKWRSGDRIEITLPMRVHVENLPNDPNTIAVLYGPIVLAAQMGTEGLPSNGQQAQSQLDFAGMKLPPAPVFKATSAEKVASQISRDGNGPLAFRADGLTLLPLYRIHQQRYAVYFKLQGATEK